MGAATLGHFDGNEAFLNLATHHFDANQNGATALIDWMGASAHAAGLEGHNAAAAADATAHLLANNKDLLAAHIPNGHGGYEGLGQLNPSFVQTATRISSRFWVIWTVPRSLGSRATQSAGSPTSTISAT
ncbi:hypothetical protein [Mycobacterium camsae]|uniref:hypothetical protein n=1 Tax=Mycobacterium gordonae TaxID=1778 RepID=UPI00197D8F28|nr:hypothetical protein [Mycobacterium gordonae]